MLYKVWNIVLAISSVFTNRFQAPVDEYPYIIPDEIPSGEPYVPQSSWEIEAAANALYGHGDDILYPEENGRSYAGIKGDEYRWPNKTIPIALSKDVFEDKYLLREFEAARQHIGNVTCVKIVPRTPEHKYYIKILKNGSKCNSFVGCHKMESQPLFLGEGCEFFGIIVHELLHAAGMWHEHCRSDRDKYVTVYKDNVIPEKWHNFEKNDPKVEQTYGMEYDYRSMMHYGFYTFSKDMKAHLKTMEAKKHILLQDPWEKRRMTVGDIKLLNKMYNC